MIKIISGQSPKIERKSMQQSVNHYVIDTKEKLQSFDANVRSNLAIPKEAIRTRIDNSYFGGALFEWVWYETNVE